MGKHMFDIQRFLIAARYPEGEENGEGGWDIVNAGDGVRGFGADAFCNEHCLFSANVGQEDDKLIPAEAGGNVVGADFAFDDLGKVVDGGVTHIVTVLVVDGFE
jgi:hypothetical protein